MSEINTVRAWQDLKDLAHSRDLTVLADTEVWHFIVYDRHGQLGAFSSIAEVEDFIKAREPIPVPAPFVGSPPKVSWPFPVGSL
jgi:hypothetical protein